MSQIRILNSPECPILAAQSHRAAGWGIVRGSERPLSPHRGTHTPRERGTASLRKHDIADKKISGVIAESGLKTACVSHKAEELELVQLSQIEEDVCAQSERTILARRYVDE